MSVSGSRFLGGCLPPFWAQTETTTPPIVVRGEVEYGRAARRTLFDRRSGLKVFGEGEALRSLECSLPRQLHNDNGRLLKTGAELDAALMKLRAKLGEV